MTPFEFFLIAFCVALLIGWARAAKGWEEAEKQREDLAQALRTPVPTEPATDPVEDDWPEYLI